MILVKVVMAMKRLKLTKEEIRGWFAIKEGKVKRELVIVQPMGKSLPNEDLRNYVDKIHMIKFDEDVLRENGLLK